MSNASRLLFFVFFIGTAVVLSGHGTLAQNKPPVIAVIDYSSAVSKSKAMQSVREQVDKQRAIYQVEVKAAQTRLQEVRQELEQQQAVLSPEAFQRKRQEFQLQADQLQRTAQSRKRSLDQMRAGGIREIEAVLKNILSGMAKKNGYDIIMNAGPGSGAIVIASTELFITEAVLKELNKKLPKVTIKPAAK